MSAKATEILTRTAHVGPQGIGDTIVFTLVTDIPIKATGQPQLVLSNGARATYSGVDGLGRPEFSYTVATGQDTTTLAITGVSQENGTLAAGEVRFAGPATVTSSLSSNNVSVQDIDGDGRKDLLVSEGGKDLKIFFGLDNDKFSLSPGGSSAFAAADINGDGRLDTIAAQAASSKFSIKLGLENGGFTRAPDLPFEGPTASKGAYFDTYRVVIADVNGDDNPDIIFTKIIDSGFYYELDSRVMSIYYGNGDGTFKYVDRSWSLGDIIIKTADVNGDGISDFISHADNFDFENSDKGNIEIRLSSADGSVRLASTFVERFDSIAVEDINVDGKLDIISGTHIHLGKGDGTFVKTDFMAPLGVVDVADIDGDGKPDLISKIWDNTDESYKIIVHRGRGDGSFVQDQTFDSGPSVSFVTAADIDGDGRSDLLALNEDGSVTLLRNTSITPTPFDGGSVATVPGSATGIRVDATAPSVGSVAASGPGLTTGTGTLTTGQTVTLTLTLSEAVTVSEAGQPFVLLLSDGGTALYDAAASTAIQLAFRHTVALGQVAADLAVTGVRLGGAVVRDAAGNAAVLSGAVTNPAGTLRIDGDTGTAGNDVFRGRGGAETFRGLAGDDTYLVDKAGDVVIEARGGGNDRILTTVSYTLAAGQEVETLTAAAALTTSTPLRLAGNGLAQTIEGNQGDNELVGKGGGDKLVGRGGNDTYFVRDASDRVYEATGGGFDTVRSSGSHSLLAGQEIELLGVTDEAGTAALTLNGNEFGQVLRGNAGANLLDGRGGADTLVGLAGDDKYVVDDPGDRVVEARGGGHDTVLSGISYGLDAGQEIETLQLLSSTGDRALKLTGNAFGQTLRGNAGANLLDGKGGADALYGSGGDDTYAVDAAGDRVYEARGQGNDTVVATTSYALADGQEIEALQLAKSTKFENHNLTGNAFGQTLRGNVGNNVLDGKAGADLLYGGEGQDAFVFSTAPGSGNVDRIADFAPVDDTIRLAKSIFAALDAGPLKAPAFKDVGNAGASIERDDRVIYDHRDGHLYYDTNGSDAGGRTLIAILDNRALLTHDDFFVV